MTPGCKREDVGLRLADTADCADLAALVASFRDFLGHRAPEAESIAVSVARLLADPGTEFMIACDRDRAIGFSQLRYRFSLWCDGIEAQIDDFFVVSDARGRGVGARLLSASIQRAREREACVIGLTTNERNADALRLYQRAGFRAERSRWNGGRQLWLELEAKQVDRK